MQRFFMSCCLILISVVSSFGQECTITYSGQVYDYHENESVPFAKIQVKEKNISLTTDENGIFKISGLCPGTYTFVCYHHVGCEPEKFQRILTKDTSEKIVIEFHFEEFETVNVVEKVYKMSPVSVVKPTELEYDAAKGKTLGDLMKNIPGVSSLNTGATIVKPVVHGMHSNRVLVMNNGIRQEGQQWGSEHAPEIDPFLVGDVALVRGPGAVRYGPDAIAGVILTAPRQLSYLPGIRGQVDAGFFSNGRQGYLSSFLEGGVKKLKDISYRVQGTYKQGGTLQAPGYYLKNTASKEINFSGNLKYEKSRWGAELFYSRFQTDLGIFTGSHIGNLTDLYKAFQAEKPLEEGSFTYKLINPKQNIVHQLYKVNTWITLNEKNRLSLQYAYQYNRRKEYDRHTSYNDSLAALNLPAFQLDLMTNTIDLVWENKWAKKWRGEVGVSFMNQHNLYEGRFFIPNFLKNTVAGYMMQVYQINQSTEVEAGLRYDYQWMNVYMYENKELKQFDHIFSNLSGSVGVARTITHHWILRANVSNAWRAPSVNELYSNGIHHGAAIFEVGNRNLKKELSYNIQTGVHYKSRKMIFQLDVYHNEMKNFIYMKPSLIPVLTIKGAFPQFIYEQVNARFTGVDIYYMYQLTSGWSFTFKGAAVRAFNKSAKNYLVGIPSDRAEISVHYKVDFRDESQLGIVISVPVVRKQIRVEDESDFVAPPKGYVLVNAQLYYSFLWKKQRLMLTIEGSNLMNTSYRDYLNRFRYYADEVGRNVGIKLKVPFNYSKK